MSDGKGPYLPASRQALRDARTVGQLNSAVVQLEKFKAVWSHLAEHVRASIASGSSPFDPEYGEAVLVDVEGVVRTIDQDVSGVLTRPLAAQQAEKQPAGISPPETGGGAAEEGAGAPGGGSPVDGEAAKPAPPPSRLKKGKPE